MTSGSELRVFISSTFRDLQEEREHLVKKIFPEIRALCRERGITFTEVDLRWGLTDEDIALGQVIRTCLEEVDNCRPYFIGITGDRYGYVPSYLDIQKDPALLKQFPWIEEVAIDGMSITEMEAHYAVLAPPPSRPSLHEGRGGPRSGPGWDSSGRREELEKARFYFRRQRETFDDDPDESTERRRLEEYQQRIHASGASIERFRDPASLGEMIFDDLVRIIKHDFADARPPTPLEQERSRHAAFSLSRRRAYIANPLYLKRLNEHAASHDPPLIVYAESGSGKSSLFAFWAEQYRRANPDVHIVEHYVGIGATATDHYAIIRHICMEINERFGRDEEIPSDPVKLETALGQWFGYAEHELSKAKAESAGRKEESDTNPERASSFDSSFILHPSSFAEHPSSFTEQPSSSSAHPASLVIILDGLNQLQGDALSLRWIPDVISPSIRLVLSSTVEGTLVELKKRGWQQIGMQALSEAERETIVVRYLAEYHKSLNPDQIGRIASDYKCGHPLFLKTVLEELRLVGRQDELDAKITSYLETTGTEDLFQKVLERLEEDYNMRAVRDIMSLLGASRGGLDERELSELSSLARLKVATMIAGLDYHLVRKDGYLTFFHDYLRRAVEKRYLSDGTRLRDVHERLVRQFASQPVSLRPTRELLHALVSLGDRDRVREVLAEIERFEQLWLSEPEGVLRLWSSEEVVTVTEAYRRGVERWTQQAHPSIERRIELLYSVAALFERVGGWGEAEEVRREQLELLRSTGDAQGESQILSSLAALVSRLGRSSEAEALAKEAEGIARAEGDPRLIANALRVRAGMYRGRGRYADALACLKEADAIAREVGDRRMLSSILSVRGLVHLDRGEDAEAFTCFHEQEIIAREVGDLRDIADSIVNRGKLHSHRGEYTEALTRFQEQEVIARQLGDRNLMITVLASRGIVHLDQGEYAEAFWCFTEWEELARQLGDLLLVAGAIGNRGIVHSQRGEYAEALNCFRKKEEIVRQIGDRHQVGATVGSRGIIHFECGEYAEAMECFRQEVEIARETGDANLSAISIGNCGNVHMSCGEYAEALACYRRAAAEHRAINYPYGLTYWLVGTAEVLVDIVHASDEMPEYLLEYVPGISVETPEIGNDWRTMALHVAREAAEESLAISRDLSKPDTLFISQIRLARISAAEGDHAGAQQRLDALLEETVQDDSRAELHFWLWKLTTNESIESSSHAEHRARALELYQSLVEKTPKHEYRTRIAELKDSPDSSL